MLLHGPIPRVATWPAPISPITVNGIRLSPEAPSVSFARTANPSYGDLSKDGTSCFAIIGSASILPYVCSSGIVSVPPR